MSSRFIIPLIAILLTACGKQQPQGRQLSAPPDSLRHSNQQISTDSLSFYLGLAEGEARNDFLVGAPEWLLDSISDSDYLNGVKLAIDADTSSYSFCLGANSARELAFYINSLQNQGIEINRELFAERLKHYILNRISPDDADREKADSISNQIILRCLNSLNSQQ